MVFITVW